MAALGAVLALRVAAVDPALVASGADSVPRVMAAATPEVNRRAA